MSANSVRRSYLLERHLFLPHTVCNLRINVSGVFTELLLKFQIARLEITQKLAQYLRNELSLFFSFPLRQKYLSNNEIMGNYSPSIYY